MAVPALEFGTDGWTLHQDLLVGVGAADDALFATANARMGVRAGAREPFGASLVLLAGCFESRPYAHPEQSYGIPDRAQTIVPVVEPFRIRLTLDGATVDPRPAPGSAIGARWTCGRASCASTGGGAPPTARSSP